MSIKILIVEDEIIIAEDLKSILEDYGYECAGIALNYTEAINVLEKTEVDIALLDINLGGRKTGIDVAGYIRENHNIPLIFISSNSDPISVKATQTVKPNGYIVKPFKKENIFASIETSLVNYQGNDSTSIDSFDKDFIFIKQNDLFHKVLKEDILWLMSDKNYTEIHTNDKRFVTRGSIKSVLENLDSNKFVRTHRSYVVNFDKIKAINSTYILLNEEKIPIGSSYKEFILKKGNLLK
jgi:two-component system response regulator LytT